MMEAAEHREAVVCMGLFGRFRRRAGSGGGRVAGGMGAGGRDAGGRRQVLDREGTAADLEHLRAFARTRRGVAFYLEPETTATDTTVVAVAGDGEWTRRRVGTPRAAAKLARRAGVAIHDVTVTGYPPAMRRWNARAKADRRVLDELEGDLDR